MVRKGPSAINNANILQASCSLIYLLFIYLFNTRAKFLAVVFSVQVQ